MKVKDVCATKFPSGTGDDVLGSDLQSLVDSPRSRRVSWGEEEIYEFVRLSAYERPKC
jgi:hypothetical protein